jgi:ribonuclease HI
VTAPVDDRILPRGVVAGADAPVQVHFDGACQPPRGGGVATFGYTIEGVGLNHEDCGLATRPFSERATNNVAEYVAAIRALEWLLEQGYRGEVILTGDSQLVIRQVRGEYEVRKEHLKAYHARLLQLAKEFRSARFEWVPRSENARADALSKSALGLASAEARKYRPVRPVEVEDEDGEEPDGGPDA